MFHDENGQCCEKMTLSQFRKSGIISLHNLKLKKRDYKIKVKSNGTPPKI